MKKIILLLFIVFSVKAFSQEHWEDNFWRDQAKKRYAQTLSMAGLYTEFYKDGQIKWQGKCLANGDPDSIWVYYNEDGKKLWEGEYTGKYYEYSNSYSYEEGDATTNTIDTTVIGNYKKGKKDGEWLYYDYSGAFINKKGHFLNGEPTGIWQEFKQESVVTKTVKSSEYDFATETKKFYNKDSVSSTQHIDSLKFSSDPETNIQYGSEDYERVNWDFIETGQYVNLTSLNNFFLQPGYSGLPKLMLSSGMGFAGLENAFAWSCSASWTPAVSAQVNDSIRLRLSGYTTSLNFGVDIVDAEAIDIVPSMGIGFQQLKMKVSKTQNNKNYTPYDFKEGDYKVYKNPAPNINAMLNLRFNIGVLTINLAGGYILDCSSHKWRYNGKYLNDSPPTSISGFIANASIGFHFG